MLLEHGADANKRYFFGSEICLINDCESLELLLTYGAQTETRDRSGMTPLMRAARQNHAMEQVLLLLSHGADVNAMTDSRNDYRTVLHYAVLSGNITLVNLLLKQGAKVDRMPPDGEADKPSPLHLAILRGDPQLVRVLLEAGGNINRCSPVIGSPLHVACADGVSHRVEIMKVSVRSDFSVVVKSFADIGIDCFQMLLSYGADPNIRVEGESGPNVFLRPPLAELLANSDTTTIEEVKLLLKYGARVSLRTQYRDPDGLLNCLTTTPYWSNVFQTLAGAAECFDLAMIKRNIHLTNGQRKRLLERAKNPMPLKAICRSFFRQMFSRTLPENVPMLFIPQTLRNYLLYEHN